MNLDTQVKKAHDLCSSGKESEALAIADELLKEHPDVLSVRMLRGHLAVMRGDSEQALAEYSKAIEISPDEPHLYMEHGLQCLELGMPERAEHDFTEGLRLCDLHKSDYYRSTLHFFRAEARLNRDQKATALEDLSLLEDGYKMWITKLRTKEEMMAECLS